MLWLVAIVPVLWVFIDVFAGFRARKYDKAILNVGSTDDYTVLVPIYGSVKYLLNVDYLASCKGDVVLCTTSGETPEFYQELERIATKHKFRVYCSSYVPVTSSKKRRTGGVIRDRVVRDALQELTDTQQIRTYTVCIDADTTAARSLDELAGSLAKSGADFASVNLVPQTDGPAIVQLQRHEYRQSMKMRFFVALAPKWSLSRWAI